MHRPSPVYRRRKTNIVGFAIEAVVYISVLVELSNMTLGI